MQKVKHYFKLLVVFFLESVTPPKTLANVRGVSLVSTHPIYTSSSYDLAVAQHRSV